jgi:precorrin-2/cobalt-factor-2 C20-methyltransferase
LRALAVIRRADVLALPRSSDFGASVAWSIVAPNVPRRGDQERLLLTFPMTKEAARVRAHVERAVDTVAERLQAGRSVAFLTEGDPSLFSTFGYVREEALRRLPALQVEVVPGVTSVTSVAMVGGVSLADGEERIVILPATYGVDDLVDLLQRFDTVVLMKLGGALPTILEALERTGLIQQAFFVAKATMAEQRFVGDVRQLRDAEGGCFAMMIVKRNDRSGRLLRRQNAVDGSEQRALAGSEALTAGAELT